MSPPFLPLVIGSVAMGLAKAEEGGATHRWTIYVRGVGGRDLSSVLAKVVFKVHPTCNMPVVECAQHPFETTQPGWGEFPATIEVFFHDETLPMIQFTHQLKLHPVGVVITTKAVVHETYDEIVFSNAQPSFIEKLVNLEHAPIPKHELSGYWNSFSDEEDISAISRAHEFIKQELEKAVAEFAQVETEYESARSMVEKRLASQAAAATTSETANTPTAHAAPLGSGNNGMDAQQPSVQGTPESKRIKLDDKE